MMMYQWSHKGPKMFLGHKPQRRYYQGEIFSEMGNVVIMATAKVKISGSWMPASGYQMVAKHRLFAP
jgi:hypothetical protein